MNNRERGSRARGVYPTQDTSHMGTARVKQEEEANLRIIVKEECEIWKKKKVESKGNSSKRILTSAKHLTLMLLPSGDIGYVIYYYYF